jgi:hypothetical protein
MRNNFQLQIVFLITLKKANNSARIVDPDLFNTDPAFSSIRIHKALNPDPMRIQILDRPFRYKTEKHVQKR